MKKIFKNWKMPEAIDVPPNYEVSAITGEYDCHLKGTQLSILDLGANIGMFALWALKKFPHSVVHCIEPIPDTYAYLKRNTEWCRFAVSTACVAVSIKSPVFINYDPEYSHLAGVRGVGNTIEVPAIHPDNLPACDLIKIDVEGGEWEIIANMNLASVKVILVEMHSQSNIDLIQNFLSERDFVIRSIRAPLYSIGMGIFAFQKKDLGEKFVEDVVELKELL